MRADRSNDHGFLVEFAAAVKARPNIHRDGCGDWALEGHYGQVYSVNVRLGEPDFQIVLEGYDTARQWGFAKKSLAFCRVTQDGDTGGVFRLERLPTSGEASVLRSVLGLGKKRELSPEQREAAVLRLASTQFKKKRLRT
jgi:hypothetical protein